MDEFTQTIADAFEEFDLNAFLRTAADAYKTVKEAEAVGQPVIKPQPGALTRLPDGSVARINADGSMTVVTPAGTQQTVGSAGIIPGVPNAVLLGAAIGIPLLLMFARRRK